MSSYRIQLKVRIINKEPLFICKLIFLQSSNCFFFLPIYRILHRNMLKINVKLILNEYISLGKNKHIICFIDIFFQYC